MKKMTLEKHLEEIKDKATQIKIGASGERFTESGWYTYCDDHERRITHWKKQTTPKPPVIYRMDEVAT